MPTTRQILKLYSCHFIAYLGVWIDISLPWIDFRFPNCVSEPLFLLSEIIGDILSEACYAFANKVLRIPRFSGRRWDDKKRAGIGVAINPKRTCTCIHQ